MRLVPLEDAHIPPLMEIARATPEVFQYTSTPATDEEAASYFGRAFRERDAGTAYPFAMIHKASGEVVGTTRYHTLNYQNRGCEVGFTWLSPKVQGTGVNLESKYLLLSHAFDVLNFLRVQFYTDSRNAQSQRAIGKLGAVYEGTLRAERIAKGGVIRDTMVFSVIYKEWPEVKRGLQAQLSAQVPTSR